jgi:hypothetical protein
MVEKAFEDRDVSHTLRARLLKDFNFSLLKAKRSPL